MIADLSFFSVDLSPQFYLSLSQFSVSKGLNLSDLGNMSQKSLPAPSQENKINFQSGACLCHGELAHEFSGSADSQNPESAAKVDMLPP